LDWPGGNLGCVGLARWKPRLRWTRPGGNLGCVGLGRQKVAAIPWGDKHTRDRVVRDNPSGDKLTRGPDIMTIFPSDNPTRGQENMTIFMLFLFSFWCAHSRHTMKDQIILTTRPA
jgi:hypothetical protein